MKMKLWSHDENAWQERQPVYGCTFGFFGFGIDLRCTYVSMVMFDRYCGKPPVFRLNCHCEPISR